MVGLGNVDNTTDLNKPISTATQTALDTLTANIDAAYAQGTVANFTANSANSVATSTQTAVANLTGSTGYIGSVKVSGDIIYNNNKSLTSQIATLNGYKTSGTFSGTTSWQTIFSCANVKGFIAITSGSPNLSMITAFFENATNTTYASLTLIASSGNNNQLTLNTSNTSSGGTQNVFIQLVATNIQVKVASPATCNWSVIYL